MRGFGSLLSHYILRDGEPVLEPDILVWARWFSDSANERVIARTYVSMLGDDLGREEPRHWAAVVSTIFLGSDHNWSDHGPAILWESLAFAHEPVRIGKHTIAETCIDGSMRRYGSRAAALDGHAEMVAILQDALRKRMRLIDDEGTHWPAKAC